MPRFDSSNTSGWGLMTRRERDEHRERMRGFTSAADCRAYEEQHRHEMEARAKARGRQFTPARSDPCTVMQQRGLLK
jgi:hypothetical protein